MLNATTVASTHAPAGQHRLATTGEIVAPPWVNEGDYADDKRHSDILGMEQNVPLETANTHNCTGIISLFPYFAQPVNCSPMRALTRARTDVFALTLAAANKELVQLVEALQIAFLFTGF